MLLSDTAIKKAIIKAKEYKLKDGGGLYLLVHPNGSKYWRLRYTYCGKEKMFAIGKYPDIALGKARDIRKSIKEKLAAGVDPVVDKRQKKAAPDKQFEKIAKEWHEKNIEKWNPKHAGTILSRLEIYIFPKLGGWEIDKIRPMDLLEELRKVEAKGKIDTTRRVLQYCASIFRYAVITGRAEYNPAQDLSGALKVYKGKNLPTIKAKELPDFLDAINQADCGELVRLATKLLLLTFVRQGELRRAKWKDIKWDEKIWEFPAENMKMKKQHIVPLAPQAIKLLKQLKKISGNGVYLFPNRTGAKHPIMSENTINKLIKDTKFEGKLVAHGFRALASTTLNEHGFRPDVIEKQLAHEERNAIRAAYNRAEYLEERAGMMKWWGDYVEGCGLF